MRAELDAGPIIVQVAVPVRPDDTAETLAERVLAEEHRIYPQAVRLIAEGRIRVADETVRISGGKAPETALSNPVEW